MTQEEILTEIENNPLILEDVDKKYLSDAEFMLNVLEKRPISFYRFINKNLLDDIDFVKRAIDINTYFIDDLIDMTSPRVRSILVDDEIFMNQLLDNNVSGAMSIASDRLKNNKNFIRKHINNDHYWVFEHSSEELRNDKEFVFDLIKDDHYWVFEHSSEELRNDKNFIIELLNIERFFFQHASYELRSDIELIKMAFDNCEYFSPSYGIWRVYQKNDGVQNWTEYIEPDSDVKYITNREYILNLVKKHPELYCFISLEFQKDEEVLKLGLKGNEMDKYIPLLENFEQFKDIFNKLINNKKPVKNSKKNFLSLNKQT